MQGESDSRYPPAAAQYQHNLERLIGDIRRDLAGRGCNLSSAWSTRLRPVSAIWLRYAGRRRMSPKLLPAVSLVDTDGLSKHDDELHYDSPGQLELGRRFANRLSRDLRRGSRARAAD